MSICRLNHVAKARKPAGTCAICHKPIETGQAYGWWKGRYTAKRVAHAGCPVPIWLRETNGTKASALEAADMVSAAQSAETPEDAAEHLRSAIATIEEIKEQLQERVDSWQGTNLEYSYQSEACQATIDEYDQWLSDAEQWADDLEAIGEPPAEPEGYEDRASSGDLTDEDDAYEGELLDWQQAIDDALGAIEDAPELDMGA